MIDLHLDEVVANGSNSQANEYKPGIHIQPGKQIG